MRVGKKPHRPTMAELLLLSSLPGNMSDLEQRLGKDRRTIRITATKCLAKDWLTRTQRGRFVDLAITTAGQTAIAEFKALLDSAGKN